MEDCATIHTLTALDNRDVSCGTVACERDTVEGAR